MTKTANLLDDWYKDHRALSSNLAVTSTIHREHVEAIYKLLLDFFGKDFFIINPLLSIKLKKIHIVHELLLKRDKAHYYKLFEFCLLIEKAKRHPEVWKKVNSVKLLSDPLRDIMFELYVATVLEVNEIPFEPNLSRQNQLLEGYCTISGRRFLHECKRKKSIISQELSLKMYLATDILESMSDPVFGFEYVVTFKVKEGVTNEVQFHSTLKRFRKYIQTRTENSEVTMECDFLRLEIKHLTKDVEIEVIQNLLPIEGYVISKSTHAYVEDDKEIFNIRVIFTGGHNKKQSVEKFFRTLRAAKKQHKSETAAARIFIFENEYLGDISAPLLRMDNYYEQEIRQYLETRNNKDLILIIFKNYMQFPPEFSSLVFGPFKFQNQIDVLRN